MAVTNGCFSGGILRKIDVSKNDTQIPTRMFTVGIRRNYKNKKTGKYDYDNVPYYIRWNENLIKFYDEYVKDGDYVMVGGHIETYQTERDGKKQYHIDMLCDEITPIGKRDTESKESIKDDKEAEPLPPAFSELSITDTDAPW